MDKRLYVGNIPYSVTSKELEDLFSQAGSVVNVRIITRPDGKSKGFGFVEMSTQEDAKVAVEKFDQYKFQNRTLKVNEAKPPKNTTYRGDISQGYHSKRYDNRGSSSGNSKDYRKKYSSGEHTGKSELNIKLRKLRRDLKDKLSKNK